MKLSKSAECALRIMGYLANESSGTMPLLSERLGIPYHHVAKLIQQMAKAQLVHTKQGKHGGVQLMKSPQSTTFKDIITLVDGPTRMADCLRDPALCRLYGGCTLQSVLQTVQHQIDSVLMNTTLDQLIQRTPHERTH